MSHQISLTPKLFRLWLSSETGPLFHQYNSFSHRLDATSVPFQDYSVTGYPHPLCIISPLLSADCYRLQRREKSIKKIDLYGKSSIQLKFTVLWSGIKWIMESAALAPSLKNIAPQQEYLLQGSILDSQRDVLLHRLRGLCDNAESSFETFFDYEAVYMLKNSSTTQQSQYVLFRVRHSLDHPEAPDHIRYLGQAEMGDRGRQTLVRACLDVACSSNVKEFLTEMGFRMDHDYVTKGYFFHKGRMKVTVFKIFRLIQPGKTDPNNLEPLGQSHLVELSVVAPLGQEQIGEDMKNFADQLKPLVMLEKFDHRRIQ